MANLTLDRVLTEAEALPREDLAMLEDLLRKRRIEAWRHDTAADAKSATKAFLSDKLKSQTPESVIARLRAVV